MLNKSQATVKKGSKLNKDYYGYIFLIPFMVVFAFFSAWPILNTFWLSMTNASVLSGFTGSFIGFDNFTSLFGEQGFRDAITNTWSLWMMNFIPQMVLALVLAAMFSSTTFKIKGSGFFKAIYYLPNILMPVTIAAMFNQFLSMHGPINSFMVGYTSIWAEPRNFLTIPGDVRTIVAFIQTWMWFGQTAIVLVAGMTSISPSFYESAMIDGANQVKMFFLITLPLLKPVLVFVLVTSLVGGLMLFDVPLLLTGQFGGPGGAVFTTQMFMNQRRQIIQPGVPNIGHAAAVSVILFFMSSAIALIIFWLLRDRTDDELKKKFEKRQAKIAKESEASQKNTVTASKGGA